MTEKQPIYDEPGECRAVEGIVELEDPDDVLVAMTPDAAEETSERLLNASLEARSQKRLDHASPPAGLRATSTGQARW